jgi:hypothetical protein
MARAAFVESVESAAPPKKQGIIQTIKGFLSPAEANERATRNFPGLLDRKEVASPE